MYCKYCGKAIDDDSVYCAVCGKSQLFADEDYQNFAPLDRIGFVDAVKSFYKNYANFKGRARRSEYWWIVLYNGLMNIALMVPVIVFGPLTGGEILYKVPEEIMVIFAIMALVCYLVIPIFYLAHIVPTISLVVRRYHDVGKSGFCYFLSFIPYAGTFIMLYYMCKESSYYDNQWGPSPYRNATEYIVNPQSDCTYIM